MTITVSRRLGLLAAAAVTMIAVTAGITYAATSSPAAHACEDSHHVLSLQRHGKCARNTNKVTLGAQGARGAAGAAGKPGVSGYEITQSSVVTVPFGSKAIEAKATCPTGKSVIGGGESNSGSDGSIILTDSYPFNDNEWDVFVNNTSADTAYTISAYAICATSS